MFSTARGEGLRRGAFDIEVLAIARAQRLRIVEVPIEWRYRPESQLSMVRDGATMLREVLRIRARARRGQYVSGGASARR